jgi:hypothetical protein
MALSHYGVAIETYPPAEVIEAHYDAVAARVLDLEPVHDDLFSILERAERTHFELMHGRYVRTGAVRESLTQRGGYGAVRDSQGSDFRFGSRVFYAHFLTKSPYDVENFQVTKRSGHGRSAVLVMPPAAKEEITRRVMRYVTEPF